MILALLLQMTFFQQQVQEAKQVLGVPLMVTAVMVPLNYNHARHLAWVGQCLPNFSCGDFNVYIADDVAFTAPPQVLRYLAYHEVCHLKLGHNLYPQEDHPNVWPCISGAIGEREHISLYGWYQSYCMMLKQDRRRRGFPLQ